jgi:hypothetical protein
MGDESPCFSAVVGEFAGMISIVCDVIGRVIEGEDPCAEEELVASAPVLRTVVEDVRDGFLPSPMCLDRMQQVCISA